MNIETVEGEIVTRLQAMITAGDVEILALPEEDTEIQPSFGKRKIIVAFSMEDADPDENTSVVIQNTQVTFGILLQGKLLRGTGGLYMLAQQVKLAVTGFRPTDCRELTYFSHKFVRNEQKVFEYLVEFKTQSTFVQDITEDTGGDILFKSAAYIDPTE